MTEACLIGAFAAHCVLMLGCLIVVAVKINKIAALVDMIEYKQKDENEI